MGRYYDLTTNMFKLSGPNNKEFNDVCDVVSEYCGDFWWKVKDYLEEKGVDHYLEDLRVIRTLEWDHHRDCFHDPPGVIFNITRVNPKMLDEVIIPGISDLAKTHKVEWKMWARSGGGPTDTYSSGFLFEAWKHKDWVVKFMKRRR